MTEASGCIFFVVREQTVFGFAVGELANFATEESGVKFDRAIEVGYGDIDPAKNVGAHFDIVIADFLRSLHSSQFCFEKGKENLSGRSLSPRAFGR